MHIMMAIPRKWYLPFLCMVFFSGSVFADVNFYVATDGNDTWTGTISSPNPDSTDGPFATLERAKQAVRDLKSTGAFDGNIYVYVREGTYYLDSPFVLDAEDSGTDSYSIIYRGSAGENAVLSGAVRIEEDWEPHNGGIMKCVIPEAAAGNWYFHQVFVNGERQRRARTPDTSFFTLAGVLNGGDDKTAFIYNEGDIQNWQNLNDAEVILIHSWTATRLFIASLDEAANIVRFTGSTVYGFDDHTATWGVRRYYVENILEGLDSPGEWYLDRPSGTLYYFPPDSIDLESAVITAPRLLNLVEMKSTRNVRISDFTVQETDWQLSETGWGGASGGDLITPSAVTLANTDGCTVKNMIIKNVGTYGIELTGTSRNNFIAQNEIAYPGCGGIHFGWGETGAKRGNEVESNHIHHVGEIFRGSVGIHLGKGGWNTVSKNHVHDISYCGVMIYGPHNVIDQNHIHHVMQKLSDGACIYSYTEDTDGTVISGNICHDSYPFHHFAWGIYLDGYSENIVVRDNTVYRTQSGNTMSNGGKNHKWINNVFIEGKDAQIYLHFDPSLTEGLRYVGNVFYFSNPSSRLIHATGNFFRGAFEEMDYNLYYCTGGNDFTYYRVTGVASFQDWQALGLDEHSIIADPLFVDPENDDYSLRENSPVFDLRTKIENPDNLLQTWRLMQNYPNPFNAGTTICFELAKATHIDLRIYDISGREIRHVQCGYFDAGEHSISWDGRNSAGLSVASGVYIYRLKTDGFTKSRKMLLLR